MARKYARDNRGRFASAGATARGGRLRTAAGNKRATVTKGIAGGKPAGAIKGKVKRDPGAAGKIGAAKPAAAKPKASAQDPAQRPTVKTPDGVKWAGNNAARIGTKPFKRSGKGQRVAGKSPAGTISQSKDTRNKQARSAAFKRRVNRASDNLRGAGKTYQTYAKAHKYGNAPGQGAKVERSYKQALQREATAKKALAVYQGTARPTVNDSRVYGRPYGKSRPAVSRTSKGYKPPSERLRAPSKTAQREGRAMNNRLRAQNRRHYTGRSRPATAGTSARALKFYKAPKSFLGAAKDRKNRKLTEGSGFRMPRSLRR